MIDTNIARFDDCVYSSIKYTSIDIFGHDAYILLYRHKI